MKINLYDKEKKDININIGDAVVFEGCNDKDYYLIIHDSKGDAPFQLLSLDDCNIIFKYKTKEELVNSIKISKNDYSLKEIISSDSLELNRIK